MKAIRIDGKEVINCQKGEWHFEALCRYQSREQLSDEATDAMIEAGRIEFGWTWWRSNDNTYHFETDKSRNAIYTSKDNIAAFRPLP